MGIIDTDDRMLGAADRFPRGGQPGDRVAGGRRADQVGEDAQWDRAGRLSSGHPVHWRRQRVGHRSGQRRLTDAGFPEQHYPGDVLLPGQSRPNGAEFDLTAHDRPGLGAHDQRLYWQSGRNILIPNVYRIRARHSAQVYDDETSWIAQKSLARCAPLMGELSDAGLRPGHVLIGHVEVAVVAPRGSPRVANDHLVLGIW